MACCHRLPKYSRCLISEVSGWVIDERLRSLLDEVEAIVSPSSAKPAEHKLGLPRASGQKHVREDHAQK
jgi:hypothetical protein